MKSISVTIWIVCCLLLWNGAAWSTEAPISDATLECLDCHSVFHPGIVEDWRSSRHAAITPAEALKKTDIHQTISSTDIPEELLGTVVGCAECHTLRADRHADTFDHNGVDVHVVVSPDDCATCHAEERIQYSKNIMAHARKNLAANTLYQKLQRSIAGQPAVDAAGVHFSEPDALTRADACFYCHGTQLEVKGTEMRDTDAGEMEFPVIDGWPNQGVGRVNPDGSQGACSACHTRHAFSIEMARKPYTCKECHVGPDVPAFKVYEASKHGNIFSAMNGKWNFSAVPWTVGKDFKAPTCAACHVSLLVNTDGMVLSERSHEMTNRLAHRIFGLIYAHPQPASPDTTIIRNRRGQPLPTDYDGQAAATFLIDDSEQQLRTETMQSVCLGCHDRSWVRGHWRKYRHTIDTTNAATRTATQLMESIWSGKLADNDNPFDEAIERQWMDVWLFYANTVRFSSAMAGGGDYGVFANGRYHLSRRIIEMQQWRERRAGK